MQTNQHTRLLGAPPFGALPVNLCIHPPLPPPCCRWHRAGPTQLTERPVLHEPSTRPAAAQGGRGGAPAPRQASAARMGMHVLNCQLGAAWQEPGRPSRGHAAALLFPSPAGGCPVGPAERSACLSLGTQQAGHLQLSPAGATSGGGSRQLVARCLHHAVRWGALQTWRLGAAILAACAALSDPACCIATKRRSNCRSPVAHAAPPCDWPLAAGATTTRRWAVLPPMAVTQRPSAATLCKTTTTATVATAATAAATAAAVAATALRQLRRRPWAAPMAAARSASSCGPSRRTCARPARAPALPAAGRRSICTSRACTTACPPGCGPCLHTSPTGSPLAQTLPPPPTPARSTGRTQSTSW